MNEREKCVLKFLCGRPKSLRELHKGVPLPMGQLFETLMDLEEKKMIYADTTFGYLRWCIHQEHQAKLAQEHKY